MANRTLTFHSQHPKTGNASRVSYTISGVSGNLVIFLNLFKDGVAPKTLTLDCDLADPQVKEDKGAAKAEAAALKAKAAAEKQAAKVVAAAAKAAERAAKVEEQLAKARAKVAAVEAGAK